MGQSASLAAAHVDSLPVQQLAFAKQATARYRDVRNAVADGYEDINVVLPNMGRHFLKQALLDSTFDIEHRGLGRPVVVNQAFDIWTLHAWVWKDNPAGIFYPTNPNVP